jgi:cytochrome c556
MVMGMTRNTLIVAVVAGLAAGGMVGGATVAFAQADVIKERQENRKQAGATMRAIKGVIDAKGDVKTIVPQAAKLKELEVAFIKLFPAGSDKGETKALPAIWTDMAGFQATNKAANDAYDKLAVAAGSGDLAAVTVAFGDTGKACGACHDKFRAKAN